MRRMRKWNEIFRMMISGFYKLGACAKHDGKNLIYSINLTKGSFKRLKCKKNVKSHFWQSDEAFFSHILCKRR